LSCSYLKAANGAHWTVGLL